MQPSWLIAISQAMGFPTGICVNTFLMTNNRKGALAIVYERMGSVPKDGREGLANKILCSYGYSDRPLRTPFFDYFFL